MDDFWVRIDKQYLHRKPGEGAREEHARLPIGDQRRRAWRMGAKGEELVGRRLAKLDRDRWSVIHDLTIGSRGANLDHLVIGPPGVFTINTKNLRGKVTVYERAVLHNGRNYGAARKAVVEAQRVQEALGRAIGAPVFAWAVLVLMGCELEVKAKPSDLSVIGRRQVPRWFDQLPTGRLSPSTVLQLERAARDPDTWP